MRRRHHLFRARPTSRRAWHVNSFSDIAYWPLTITPALSKSKQPPSWAMAGSVLTLCASLLYAFGQ
jgi:hypothetical protein